MKYIIIILLLIAPLHAGEKEKILVLSAYCSCGHCCGWTYNKDGIPVFNYGKLKGKKKIVGKTASGKMAKQGRTLAMPSKYPFGTKLYIKGKLFGICEDRGGAIRESGNVIKIDVFFDKHQDALEFSVKKYKLRSK